MQRLFFASSGLFAAKTPVVKDNKKTSANNKETVEKDIMKEFYDLLLGKDQPESTEDFYQSAVGFGRFQLRRQLSHLFFQNRYSTGILSRQVFQFLTVHMDGVVPKYKLLGRGVQMGGYPVDVAVHHGCAPPFHVAVCGEGDAQPVCHFLLGELACLSDPADVLLYGIVVHLSVVLTFG